MTEVIQATSDPYLNDAPQICRLFARHPLFLAFETGSNYRFRMGP